MRLIPWSFTNKNLPFLMVIAFFFRFFPSKKGVRGVTPDYECEKSPGPTLTFIVSRIVHCDWPIGITSTKVH